MNKRKRKREREREKASERERERELAKGVGDQTGGGVRLPNLELHATIQKFYYLKLSIPIVLLLLD